MSLQVTPELVTSIAGLVTAIGFAFKSMRDARRERRARRHDVERVARAAAKGPRRVAELVDECERTGEFTRPTALTERRARPRVPARARGSEPPDT